MRPDELDRIISGQSTMRLSDLRDEYDQRDVSKRIDHLWYVPVLEWLLYGSLAWWVFFVKGGLR